MRKSNVKLKASIKSNDDDLDIITDGLRDKNKITYKENNIIVTILLFNSRIEMNRKASDYEVNLIFNKFEKTISTYTFVGGNKVFELTTNTKEIIINDSFIKIEYELEENSFSYTLEMEDL